MIKYFTIEDLLKHYLQKKFHILTNTATLQVIRLEIGALAAWTPAKTAQIEPYAAEYYPKIYSLSL